MNHIYELNKGVRQMVLFTCNKKYGQLAVERLESQGIPYVLQPAGQQNLNVYFGRRECLEAIRLIVTRPLNQLTPEEDFILGAMLGYDLCAQCERYCKRKQGSKLGCEALNVQDLTADVVAANQNLILGTSTWGAGELQDDWYDGLKTLQGADLSGKTIALFGCGDCSSYSDTFVGGIGELYNGIKDSGAKFIGAVETDGYTFDDSEAIIDGKFIGLPLDDVNEDDKTDTRIEAWLAAITPQL